MALKNKLPGKALGIALMVVGIGLAIWGYRMSGAITSEISQAVTGAYTDKVMMLYIGGAAAIVVGLFLYSKR